MYKKNNGVVNIAMRQWDYTKNGVILKQNVTKKTVNFLITFEEFIQDSLNDFQFKRTTKKRFKEISILQYKEKISKSQLENLSKLQLIALLLKQNAKPVLTLKTEKPVLVKPIPTLRKSVKNMVKDYEENILLPPFEFRDKPIPAPRTKKTLVKSIPAPRTKVIQTDKALKSFTKSFEISIKHNKDPLIQLTNIRKAIESLLKKQLDEMNGMKAVETLKVTFEKQLDEDKTIINPILPGLFFRS